MRKGFTLIELLIVIAIIAILALVAIPNFLEAQMRARVARVHADMRTLGFAVESYIVDYNWPPPGYNAYQDITGKPKEWSYNALTTPIAYLTAPLSDPFMDYAVNDDLKPRNRDPYYDYQTYCPYPPLHADDTTAFRLGYVWVFASPGPSRRWGSPYVAAMLTGNQAITNIYDPTNGTVSWGLIWRTNKGVGLEGGKWRK